jgi:hypothetical protein
LIAETGRFLDGLAALIVPVKPHFLWRPQLRGPNDEMVLEAAVSNSLPGVAPLGALGYLTIADFE